jgi:hypothetical protein
MLSEIGQITNLHTWEVKIPIPVDPETELQMGRSGGGQNGDDSGWNGSTWSGAGWGGYRL